MAKVRLKKKKVWCLCIMPNNTDAFCLAFSSAENALAALAAYARKHWEDMGVGARASLEGVNVKDYIQQYFELSEDGYVLECVYMDASRG